MNILIVVVVLVCFVLFVFVLVVFCVLFIIVVKSCLDFVFSGVVFVGVSFARGFKSGVNTYRRAISVNLEMGGLDVDVGVVVRVGVIDVDGSVVDVLVCVLIFFFNVNVFLRFAYDVFRVFSAA